MKYWLLKSEPSAYGIDDLVRDSFTAWTGVRNYQARNFMRDDMRPGDRGFFFHSSCEEPGIVGIVEVSRGAYPDPTQFDRKSRYYDPGAARGEPRWFNVDVKFVDKTRVVGLAELLGAPVWYEGQHHQIDFPTSHPSARVRTPVEAAGLRKAFDGADAVRVETEEREDAIVFHLHVAPDDVGKVIGRQGRIARALRSVVRAGGARERERYLLEIAG